MDIVTGIVSIDAAIERALFTLSFKHEVECVFFLSDYLCAEHRKSVFVVCQDLRFAETFIDFFVAYDDV